MTTPRFRSGLDDVMPQNFSSLLDRFFQETVNRQERLNRFSPATDSCETENSYEIEVALPGFRKEDIQLDYQQGRLTISGERKFQKEANQKKYYLLESQYGSFSRSFQLPETVDAEKIEAVFKDGILHVAIPKDERKTKRQRIEVRDGNAQSLSLDNSPAQGNKQQSQENKNSASRKKRETLAHENGTH